MIALGQAVAAAGVDLLSAGIGWRESRVPTLDGSVPPGAFRWVTGLLREQLPVPLIAGNRIDTPELAESNLAAGEADLVALARPLLGDAAWVSKAARGRRRTSIPVSPAIRAVLTGYWRVRRSAALSTRRPVMRRCG